VSSHQEVASSLATSLTITASRAELLGAKSLGHEPAKASWKAPRECGVARNIAVILHRMWVDGTEFIASRDELNAATAA